MAHVNPVVEANTSVSGLKKKLDIEKPLGRMSP
jgi:hypothetical protein